MANVPPEPCSTPDDSGILACERGRLCLPTDCNAPRKQWCPSNPPGMRNPDGGYTRCRTHGGTAARANWEARSIFRQGEGGSRTYFGRGAIGISEIDQVLATTHCVFGEVTAKGEVAGFTLAACNHFSTAVIGWAKSTAFRRKLARHHQALSKAAPDGERHMVVARNRQRLHPVMVRGVLLESLSTTATDGSSLASSPTPAPFVRRPACALSDQSANRWP